VVGKDRSVGKARRGIRVDVVLGVTVEVKLHRFKKKLKWS